MNKMPKLGVLVALFAALVAASCCCNAAAVGRVDLIHTGAGSGLTGHAALHSMARRSKARAKRLLHWRGASAPLSPGLPAAHDNPGTEYVARFGIGTPPQPVQLIFDTGSDLTWTQCQPCHSCFHQALPHFDPLKSSTFRASSCKSKECQLLISPSCGARSWGNETCAYGYYYGDGSATKGILAVDTFTFAAGLAGRRRHDTPSSSVPGLPFGCGFFNTGFFENNKTGVAGFGRGALSLPSQLKLHNFSHCFTTNPFTASGSKKSSKPSSLLLDLPARLYRGARGAVQTTRLLQNPQLPGMYYLSLKGITVGATRLPVPESAFALARNGSGGTIIDSGSSFMVVPPQVHRLLKAEFTSQLARGGGAVADAADNICFTVAPGAKLEVPKLVLHLEGATLDLPPENYIFKFQEAGHTLICLAVVEGDDTTFIGNFQQQNLHVLYDLANNKLSFVPAQCDKF